MDGPAAPEARALAAAHWAKYSGIVQLQQQKVNSSLM